jgi:hypothetical protein
LLGQVLGAVFAEEFVFKAIDTIEQGQSYVGKRKTAVVAEEIGGEANAKCFCARDGL